MNEINEKIKEAIQKKLPLTFGKIGGFEASHLHTYLSTNDPKLVRGNSLSVNAGITTRNSQELKLWCEYYIQSIKNLDYVLEWCTEQGDTYVLDKIWDGEKRFEGFSGLEPFTHEEEGWHYSLGNKKILVVSPFKDTILQQSQHYDKIWKNADSPKEVYVVKSQFSAAIRGEESPKPFYKHLSRMKSEILNYDFDFAVVGCGGFSLILLEHIKKMGIPAVHLGGATQILFGIRGRRWDNNSTFVDSNWYGGKHWIRPLSHEIPQKANLVEGGCYW